MDRYYRNQFENANNEEFAGLCNEIFIINAFLKSKRTKCCFESCYIDTYFLKNKKYTGFIIWRYNQKVKIFFQKKNLLLNQQQVLQTY